MFFIVYFPQMLKKNDLLDVLYKSRILQQIKLVAIYTDENDLDCRELFPRMHFKNDEILFFNDIETVTALVQVLPNITSPSAALILTFLLRYGLTFEPVEKNRIFLYVVASAFNNNLKIFCFC